MDIKLRYKEGKAMAVTKAGEARIIKLVLKDEFLEIMEKLNPCKLDSVGKNQQIVSNQKLETESSFSYSKLPVERTVNIVIDENNPSLGISVKGGSDFNLPLLISRIIPGERADKSKRLFVGDAILELNGKSMLSYTHKEAVDALLSAGSHVILQVRHVSHAATVLLNEGVFKKQLSTTEESEQCPKRPTLRKDNSIHFDAAEMKMTINNTNGRSEHEGSTENINQLPSEEYAYLIRDYVSKKMNCDSKNWVIGLRISLQYAYLSTFEYRRSNHVEKLNSFMVRSIEGHSSGIISFKDPNQFHYWKEAIKFNINSLLINNIKKYNTSSSKENQVHYMGWLYFVSECSGDVHRTCKSYHESEYANIDASAIQEVRSTVTKNRRSQCVSKIQKSTDFSSSLKWCYLPVSNLHKSSVTTTSKTREPEHSNKSWSEVGVHLEPNIQSHHRKEYSTIDRPLFIILRGIYIFIFVKPPTVLGDWFNPLRQHLVSRSLIEERRMSSEPMSVPVTVNNTEDVTSSGNLAMTESVISQNSCKHRDLSPTNFILKIELTEFECITDSMADLIELETIWIRVNYYAVCQKRMDSFKCIYQNIDSILCLDFDYGLKLINAADGIKIWQYKYHQLRASSDDGENRLRLIFTDQNNSDTRIDQVLHCHNLATVLISIQSFLTAKLGQVDPHYFDT